MHPFGNLHRLPTYLDSSVLENEVVNSNAGLHTVSIQMKAKDLVKAINPVIREFSRIQKIEGKRQPSEDCHEKRLGSRWICSLCSRGRLSSNSTNTGF